MSTNPDVKKQMSPEMKKRLATYATVANATAVTGLALSGIAHANGVRVEIDPDVVHTAIGQPNGYGIDFDQDGDIEFAIVRTNTFASSNIYLDIDPFGNDVGNAAIASLQGGIFYAKALAASTDVGPARTDFLSNPIFTLGYGAGGNFPNAGDQYVGVRFRLNSNPTDFYYGWILLNVNADSTAVTIKAYGYNDTPNTPIPTAVSLSGASATAAQPWWQQAAIALFTGLTAVSLWARRQFGRSTEQTR